MESTPVVGVDTKNDRMLEGWAPSFYALLLKYCLPKKVGDVFMAGVPTNEFNYLKSERRIPDLLLWGDLFLKLSISELMGAIGDSEVRIVSEFDSDQPAHPPDFYLR